jgi:hypothetical protein
MKSTVAILIELIVGVLFGVYKLLFRLPSELNSI